MKPGFRMGGVKHTPHEVSVGRLLGGVKHTFCRKTTYR